MIERACVRGVLGLITLIAMLSGCGGRTASPRSESSPGRIASSVIIIHGVGNQTAGYSRPLQDLLKAGNPSLHFTEVLWSDLGGLLRRAENAEQTAQRKAAEQELLAEIDAAERKARASRIAAPGAAQDDKAIRDEYAAARGFVSPIVSYEFLSAAERRRIQSRLRDALDWSAQHADKTYVIAHSLGSVIAFDSLHAWEGGTPPGNVVVLLTMGSPLGKRVFAHHGGRPAGRPGTVQTWLNFYSVHDPIASALAGIYGQVEDRGVKTSILPLSAHSAYWTHADVVNELLNRVR